jgi:hypothetical protein
VHLGLKNLLEGNGPLATLHLTALEERGTKHNLAQFRLYAQMMGCLIRNNSDNPDWADTYKACEVKYDLMNARLYLPIYRTLAGWNE